MYQSLPASPANTGSCVLLTPAVFTESHPVSTAAVALVSCETEAPSGACALSTGAARTQPSSSVFPLFAECCHVHVMGIGTWMPGPCGVTRIGLIRSKYCCRSSRTCTPAFVFAGSVTADTTCAVRFGGAATVTPVWTTLETTG